MLSRAVGSRRGRHGFSLVELLVALVLLGLATTAAFGLLQHSLRGLRRVAARGEIRGALWQATAAFASQLQSMAPVSGDLTFFSDSSVAFRALVGTAVACLPPAGATVDLAPDSLVSGASLSTDLRVVRAGDLALVFDDGPSSSSHDDTWRPYRVASVSRVANNCAGSPWLDTLRDAGRAGYRITLSAGSTLPSGALGTPLRFVRDARYRFYRATSGEWSLGWMDSNTVTGWTVVQPLAGPFLPWAAAGKGGIALTFLDSLSLPVTLANASTAAAVALVARSAPSAAQRWRQSGTGTRPDSLVRLIGVRNRR